MARHLVTSALPYINGVKHLGNLVGSMLPADVVARYLRARGHEVLFICATDEHGTPAELAAAEAGLDVQVFCDQAHAVQADLNARYGLSFDFFGRTSDQHNHVLTQHFARQLAQAGLLEKRTIEMIYSPTDGRFLPDRYVTGTCPYCGYDKARGDQCDGCGRLLDPTMLINPRSTVSGATDLEVRASASLFLRQSQMVDTVANWVDQTTGLGDLPRSIARKWLDEGLEDRDITRDLKWGIPVPSDLPGIDPEGLANKVWYVWFDAPIGYIGATAQWADANGADYRDWWFGEAASDVTYTQIMGKDNVAFHTVSFPITQLGSGEPWKMVDRLKAFNWLTYYGGKFSTSQGVGVFMDQALEVASADAWRWYLISNAPESSDTSFTWDAFARAMNTELAGNLGNYVNRCLAFTAKKFAGEDGPVVPSEGTPGEIEYELGRDVAAKVDDIALHFDAMEMRKATRAIRELWSLGNQYLETREPWRMVKTDPDMAQMVLRTAIQLIPIFASVASPVIPNTATTLGNAVDVSVDAWPEQVADLIPSAGIVPAGQPFTVPPILFAKVDDQQIEEWSARFGGQR
ncbi:methionine--tRNA ligase [Stomatohabitans albus]|uniref:methionine--tRNA ligase n=1 Tax=Stomatohabitans albus TaxID=3110766 RepID=UPI00300C0C6B